MLQGYSSMLYQFCSSVIVDQDHAATIQYELDQSHTFEFPEGGIITPISTVDIKAYYPAEDQYFQYYDSNYAPSLTLALAQLESYIQIEGPFDGVLGFSQGASLAAAYLVRLSRDFPSRPLPFRCAIFFSGGPPFDPQALEQIEVRIVDAEETGPILRLPTANIWGRNDEVWPGAVKSCATYARTQTRLCTYTKKDTVSQVQERRRLFKVV
ncbi:hypothetical protein XPA_005704 [Xanthoria parietina]